MRKVRKLANFAKQTPIPRTKTEPPSAVHVREVVLPKQEVLRAAIVWRGNLKKRQTPTKRFVPFVYRGITQTSRTRPMRANTAPKDATNRLMAAPLA